MPELFSGLESSESDRTLDALVGDVAADQASSDAPAPQEDTLVFIDVLVEDDHAEIGSLRHTRPCDQEMLAASAGQPQR